MLEHWRVRIDKALNDRLPMVLEVEEQKVQGECKYVKEPFVKSGAYNANVQKWMCSVGLCPEDRPISGPFSRVKFRRLSLDKPDEVKDYLLELGWIPAQWNTNDAGERTSPKLDKDDPFDGVEGNLGRLVARYKQCQARKSIMEGWITTIRPDGRIPSVVANLAETGRATHRNIVNVPNAESFFGKWMRKSFIAKDGWVLVSADSAGNQLRQLAARMGDDAYQQTILFGDKDKGTDIHTVNMKAAGLRSRAQAKTFIYGFLFGAGDAKVGRIIGGDAAAGRKLKEQFLEGLPALADLLDRLVTEWRKNAKKRPGKWGRVEYYEGWITGLDGRPIFCASEHAILVYMLQSDEAIQMSAAYVWMYKDLSAKYKWGEDFGIVCFYHDEYTIECRPEIAEDCAKIMEECIVKAGKYYNIRCPHEGEAKIGRSWYDVH
jgi:DNA polymerase-1